jgi:hypothetical protein
MRTFDMNRLSVLAIFTTLILCGCSTPHSVDEMRTWARTSSMSNKKEYQIANLDMDTAESRLRAFTQKCLRRTVSQTVKKGSAGFKFVDEYNPRVFRSGKMVTLVLQVNPTPGTNIGVPDGGVYELIVEATPIKTGVNIFSAKMTSSFGHVGKGGLEDIESWLRGTRKFCPDQL